MKLIPRWFVTSLVWVSTWLPMYIFGYMWTFIPLLFTNRNSDHMPFFGWFWDSNHGIHGALGYNNLKWVYACNKDRINERIPLGIDIWRECRVIVDNKSGNERTFWNKWKWITFRNPVTNLSLYVIGFKVTKPVEYYSWMKGLLCVERLESGWMWLYTIRLFYSKAKTHYFHYSFGWKLNDLSEGRARFIYRISPWRTLTIE